MEKSLRLIFEDAARIGREVTITIPKCDDTKTGAAIKTVMTAIHDNCAIFVPNIGAIKGAKWVTPAVYTEVTLPA